MDNDSINITAVAYNIQEIRSDFPILQEKIHGKPLVYLDNGATTQKPLQVIRIYEEFLGKYNSSIHRGVHYLSDYMTNEYEKARVKVQEFIGAAYSHEIIFTSGTTASINTVAFSYGERYLKDGDEIILSQMEHHANIVPWQMLSLRKKLTINVIPVSDSGELTMEAYQNLFTDRTKLVAVTWVSNVLGTINPLRRIVDIAHQHNVPVLVDAAQAVQHMHVDVKEIGCDFMVFSGHKMYGPTGIGVLYGQEKWLEELPPWQGGGDMVDVVTFEKTTYNQLPFKFEAGTTNYIGAIGLGAAIDYITQAGLADIAAHEQLLLNYGLAAFKAIPEITLYGTALIKSPILSFTIQKTHPLDVGMILDKMGIAVRTGSHCAQPLMQRYGIQGTIRASMAMYNTCDEIDNLTEGIKRAIRMLI